MGFTFALYINLWSSLCPYKGGICETIIKILHSFRNKGIKIIMDRFYNRDPMGSRVVSYTSVCERVCAHAHVSITFFLLSALVICYLCFFLFFFFFFLISLWLIFILHHTLRVFLPLSQCHIWFSDPYPVYARHYLGLWTDDSVYDEHES